MVHVPEFADVKLIQTVMLMNELDTIVMTAQAERGIGCKTAVPGMPGIPIAFCGDLNSLPDSSVVQCLINGRVPIDHPDALRWPRKHLIYKVKLMINFLSYY